MFRNGMRLILSMALITGLFTSDNLFADDALKKNSKALILASNGGSDYIVVQSEKATKAEKFASAELAGYLEKITGAKFNIIKENAIARTDDGKKYIYVGNTEYAAKNGIDIGKLGFEEWVIRTDDSNNLIISGGRPKGTLYGVYEFLEKYCGCLWLDEQSETILKQKTLGIPEINVQDKPVFRDRLFVFNTDNPEKFKLFNARNKSSFTGSDLNLGSCKMTGSPGNCHTFYYYSKDWPEDHPEYFSLAADGRRLRAKTPQGPGQICLTNPEVRKLMVKKLKEYIAGDRKDSEEKGIYPAPWIYDITNNDNLDKCVCPSCMALMEKEGAYSGVLIDFINEIADGIKDEYPDVLVQTFAYTFIQEPPKNIRPRDNVIIRLADLPAMDGGKKNILRPFASPENKGSFDLLNNWAGISKHLSYWDYWVFYKNLFPYPYTNISIIQPNLKLLRDKKVENLCIECEYPENTSFFPLKRWLGYKMMQNPEQDAKLLIRKFMDAYYGKASENMNEYLNFLETCIAESKDKLGEVQPVQLKYLDADFFMKANKYFDDAEIAVKDSPEHFSHVRQERAAVDSAMLNMWNKLGFGKSGNFDFEKILARCQHTQNTLIEKFYLKEKWDEPKKNMQREINSIRLKMTVPLPAEFKTTDDSAMVTQLLWPEFKENVFISVKYKDDNKAAGSKAVMLGEVKDNPKFKHEFPIDAGIYSNKDKIHGPSIKITEADLSNDGTYKLIRIGKFKITPNTFIWIQKWYLWIYVDKAFNPAEPNNEYDVYVSLKAQGPAYISDSKDENGVLVDRVILVKVK